MALERKVIVERALDLLDEVGMDGLSTRRLAAELGVKGPSLYWHFKNMRELFDHMAEALLETALPAPDAFPSDCAGLATASGAARHPTCGSVSSRRRTRLMASSTPTGKSTVLNLPAMTGRLQSEGFRYREAYGTLIGLGRYAMGWAFYECN